MNSAIVAVVGGGQLARMMAPAATALGIELRVLVESPEASAALAAHQCVVGLPSDPQAVRALFAAPVPTVVTWEHEHIGAEVFAEADAAGIPARPGLEALLYAQDKIEMRSRMDALGAPNPQWRAVTSAEDIVSFLAEHGPEVIAKTARGGYDGKGVRVISSAADVSDWLDAGTRMLVERKVDFIRELSAQVARRPSGDIAIYPVVASLQRDGVCAEVTAPAPELDPAVAEQASSLARMIAAELDVTGMLAVELFETADGVVVNELAMRPHNSGHWTIEGCVTSQFEQHLRAVLDLPLGSTRALAPVTVMANVLGGARRDLPGAHAHLTDPEAKVHLYGKQVRAGRKVGHVTVMGDDVQAVTRAAVSAARLVAEGSES